MKMKEEYCFYCMEHKTSGQAVCPACGKENQQEAPSGHLPIGTILNEKYLTGAVLGEGGFGITYIGRDLTLDMKVAVKEYFPAHLARRDSKDGKSIRMDESAALEFERGKEEFLTEARTLAKFPYEDGIVGVRDFFQENGTGYLVMEYLEGLTLGDYLNTVPRISFQKAVKMLLPVMNALEKVHDFGMIHRDISPDNIMITTDGKVKLLDFGASRSVRQKSQGLTVILKPCYAPEEQYRKNGNQGPWTDIYAICAVIYRCITGTMPEDSIERLLEDGLKRPSEAGADLTPAQEAALLKGLEVQGKKRYQTIEELKNALLGEGEAAKKSVSSRPERAAEESAPAPPQPGVQALREAEQATVMPGAARQPERLERTMFVNPGETAVPKKETKADGRSEETKADGRSEETKADGRSEETKADDGSEEVKAEETAKETEPQNTPAPNMGEKKKKRRKKAFLGLCAAAAIVVCALAVKLNTSVTIGRNTYPALSRERVEVFETDTKVTQSQIKALRKIKNLQSVLLNECWLTDREVQLLTESLKQKKEMIFLHLTNNKEIKDISPLAELEQLRSLSISSTSVTDLSPVGSLKQLSSLYISDLGISDLEFLRSLEQLHLLNAENNQIEDLTPLEHSSPATLQLSNNRIRDISPLRNNEELYGFTASNNQISDISALADKKDLYVLDLSNNKISDVSPLRADTDLTFLTLSGNEITDISSWQYLKKLKSLAINVNRIEDIEALSNMKDLETLDLSNNQIEDISPLKDLQNLKLLNLTNNRITDISPLMGHEGQNPFLAGNRISDLSPLPSCYSLPAIDLSGNQISDLEALGTMKQLKFIDLRDNPITDLSPLYHLEELEALGLTYRPDLDLSQLWNLSFGSLGTVILCGVPEEEKLAVEDLFSEAKFEVKIADDEEWEIYNWQ